MGRYFKVVAVFLLVAQLSLASARSFFRQQDVDGDDESVQDRQFGGGVFFLPPWLDRLRNIPSSLLGNRVTIEEKAINQAKNVKILCIVVQPVVPPNDTPKATNKKPVEVLNWPSIDLDVGQITGVAVDENANPVILHRGNVKWTGR